MVTRRSFIAKGAMAVAAAVMAPSLYNRSLSPEGTSPLNGKKVLFIWGGWMGHEPDKCRDIFVPWMESEGAGVTVSRILDTYINMDLKKDFDMHSEQYYVHADPNVKVLATTTIPTKCFMDRRKYMSGSVEESIRERQNLLFVAGTCSI